MATVRVAQIEDGTALAALDRATWSPLVSPGPVPPQDRPFFGALAPESALVAEEGGAVAGYIVLEPPTPLASNAHVLHVAGLAVDPEHQRRGIARTLLEAGIDRARERGARRVTLRVLAPNTGARALYERCGFVVEGVLRGEFRRDGRDIDDVLMAYTIA